MRTFLRALSPAWWKSIMIESVSTFPFFFLWKEELWEGSKLSKSSSCKELVTVPVGLFAGVFLTGFLLTARASCESRGDPKRMSSESWTPEVSPTTSSSPELSFSSRPFEERSGWGLSDSCWVSLSSPTSPSLASRSPSSTALDEASCSERSCSSSSFSAAGKNFL